MTFTKSCSTTSKEESLEKQQNPIKKHFYPTYTASFQPLKPVDVLSNQIKLNGSISFPI
jgi:hypothetical protein